MNILDEPVSIGARQFLNHEDLLATLLEFVRAAWPRVLRRGDVDISSQEPELAGALYLELWNEKNERVAIGSMKQSDPPFFDDEVSQRRRQELVALGRVDIRMLYSMARDGFFTFECKRVNRTKARAKYYVEHGVRRFSKGVYCAGHLWAGMLGFVVHSDVSGSVGKVRDFLRDNPSVTDLAEDWTEEKRFGTWTHLYRTKHRQQGHGTITLLHLFLTFDRAAS